MNRSIFWSLLTVFCSLALMACGHDRGDLPAGPPQPGPGIGDTLQTIGRYGLYIGSAGLAVASLALVASFFSLFSAFLSPSVRVYLIDAIILSGALILIASTVLYLGEHVWLIALAIAAVVAVLLVRYRLVIERDLGITQTTTTTPQAAPGAPVVASSVTAPVPATVPSAAATATWDPPAATAVTKSFP